MLTVAPVTVDKCLVANVVLALPLEHNLMKMLKSFVCNMEAEKATLSLPSTLQNLPGHQVITARLAIILTSTSLASGSRGSIMSIALLPDTKGRSSV